MSEQSPFLPTTSALMPLPEASDALPVGTRLGEFEIREVIGVGGFGIVYRAWEPALEREVALKEYMPMGMVAREADGRVALRSRSVEADYTLGLRSFVNEARLLAKFDHPSLVKVHRFWEANGTAYMAMPFYKAQTLRQRRQELGASAPTQEWLMSMVEPLLGALAEMHRVDVYHRDIAPDNILWCVDNRPVLLDFGAARQVLADRTQHLTAVLKPQFAPIEQYADARTLRQGPWTDVFALASTCYFMLTGRPPLPATARILGDDLPPLAQLQPPGFAPHVLAALDWAMAVRPQDRPQSVAMLWDALHGHVKVPERVVEQPTVPAREAVAPGDYKRTIQTTARPTDDRTASAWLRPSLAAPVHVAARLPGAGLRAAVSRVKRFHWMLLGLAAATGVAATWFGHDGTASLDAASAAASAPAASASMADAASPARPASQPQATAAAHAIAASAPVHAATTASATHAPGPRETCAASRSSNVDECVKRVCKSEPRFRRYETCIRLQKQAEPWWKFFKGG